jgi:glycine cleavage system H protein
MDFSDCRFSEAHTWAKRDGDQVFIGITQFAADQLGDIIFIELPDVGASIVVEEGLGSVESAKAVEDLVSPLSGEVTQVNEELLDAPEILNEDPYAQGWLIAIKATDANAKEFDSLLGHDNYMAMLEESGDGNEEDDEDDNLYDSEE